MSDTRLAGGGLFGQSLVPFLVRLTAAYALLGAAAFALAGPASTAVSPFVALGFIRFLPEVELRSLSSTQGRVKAEVVVLADGPAGSVRHTAEVGASAGSLAVAPLLTVSILLAWRFRSLRQKAAALALGALLAGLVVAHDVPQTMVQGITKQMKADPGALGRFHLFFLNNGGRQALALAAAGAAIWIATTRVSVPGEVRGVGRRARRAAAA